MAQGFWVWKSIFEMSRYLDHHLQVRAMRLFVGGLLVSLGVGLGLAALPAQAQISEAQVGALVEALRQSAPETGREDDGLYSEWQVKPENIPRWSRSCIDQELTPAQFEASPAAARTIVSCVMRDVLRDEYRASGNDEAIAVRRAAAWWMTGDPDRYDSGDTAAYTQQILRLYQQRQPVNAAANPSRPAPLARAAVPQLPVYDRYMRAGYAATERRDYETALVYFRRALDERPNDSFAEQAIQNVEGYRDRPTGSSSDSSSGSTSQSNAGDSILTQQQAVQLISRWLDAKEEIFAPPYNEQLVTELTTGELYDALAEPDGVLDWLQTHLAYYRFGVQRIESVNRFAADRDRATIEVELTEDRTLYQGGRVNPNLTNFETELVRFTLESVDGGWKIADYKTDDGSLLERSVLEAAALTE